MTFWADLLECGRVLREATSRGEWISVAFPSICRVNDRPVNRPGESSPVNRPLALLHQQV